MLLTDEEIAAIHDADDGSKAWGSYRAIEAAILAKLASAELPEPAMKETNPHLNSGHDPYNGLANLQWFTADQLRQAYAQGAAAQLSAEPIGEFEALPDPTVGELAWLNIYDAKSRVAGTKLYTRREAND